MSGQKPTIYEEIEVFSELQFSIEEVALLVEREESFLDKPEAQRAYMRGRLRAQAAVRKSIKQMAANGVNSAQKLFQDLAEKSEPVYEEDCSRENGNKEKGESRD